jgi:hypothetical protein
MWDASQGYRRTSFRILPDYSSSIADVYVQGTYMAIYESQDLGMLGLVEDTAFRHDPTLPSWVPDYRIGHQMLPLTNQVRNGTRSSRWKASRQLLWKRQDTIACSGFLPVEGLHFDVVEDTGPTHAEMDSGFGLKDMLRLLVDHPLDSYPSQGVATSEVFWRTIVQDTFREEPADNPLARDAFVAAAVGKMLELEAAITAARCSVVDTESDKEELDNLTLIIAETSTLLSQLSTQAPFAAISKALRAGTLQNLRDRDDFDESFRIAYYGRRLFRTVKGYFGITAQSLQKGDSVWVLAGADTPIVLRKWPDDAWQLVGEAYVFGIMNGEALVRATQLEKVILR